MLAPKTLTEQLALSTHLRRQNPATQNENKIDRFVRRAFRHDTFRDFQRSLGSIVGRKPKNVSGIKHVD